MRQKSELLGTQQRVDEVDHEPHGHEGGERVVEGHGSHSMLAHVGVGEPVSTSPGHALGLLHDVFLQVDDHLAQAPPHLLDRRHHAIDVGIARQLDVAVAAVCDRAGLESTTAALRGLLTNGGGHGRAR